MDDSRIIRKPFLRNEASFGGTKVCCSSCGVYIGWTHLKKPTAVYCRALCSLNPPAAVNEERDSIIIYTMAVEPITAEAMGDMVGMTRSGIVDLKRRRLADNPRARRGKNAR